jgi:serine/threonine-protein kinase
LGHTLVHTLIQEEAMPQGRSDEKNAVLLGGQRYPILERLRVGGRDYLLLERLSPWPRMRYLAWDGQAAFGGQARRLLILPRDAASRQQLAVLRRLSRSSDHYHHVLDFRALGDRWVVVMDWIAGIDLKQFLDLAREGNKPRPGATVVLMRMRGLVHAMARTHRRFRVCHGDIKPSNLLVANDSGRFVLIDFGSAWLAERSAAREPGDGQLPAYAAPELQSGGPAHVLSEQFSLGVVLYELLTLQLPYGVGGKAARAKIDALVPPSQLSPERHDIPGTIWRQIDELACRSVALEPRERFASLQDMATAFDAVCADITRPKMLSPMNERLTRVVAWLGDRFRMF